jgi:hypothetical protein
VRLMEKLNRYSFHTANYKIKCLFISLKRVLEEATIKSKDSSLDDLGVQKNLKIFHFSHLQIISNNFECLALLLAKIFLGSPSKKLLTDS